MKHRLFVWNWVVVLMGLPGLAGCESSIPVAAHRAHPVAIHRVQQPTGPVHIWSVGRVMVRASDAEGASRGSRNADYRISVPIPENTEPAFSLGQSVRVILPIVHEQEASARVEAVTKSRVELLLPAQVQVLGGQEVKVELILKSRGIFRLPFNSIYSPRGTLKQAFVVRNGRAEARELKVVAPAGATEVLVTGGFEAQDEVVVQGLDNLMSGDEVTVLSAAGSLK